MSLGKNVVVHGATLKCSQSETMSFLKARDLQMEVEGKFVATVDDHKPTENILPFGICKHPKWKNKPCKPITPSPWEPGEKSIDLENQIILDVKSECKCNIGGMISIIDPGQTQPFFTVDCVSYSNEALDFLRERHLALKRRSDVIAEQMDAENEDAKPGALRKRIGDLIDVIPFAGSAKGINEAITGWDPFNQKEVEDIDRFAGVIPYGKKAKKGFDTAKRKIVSEGNEETGEKAAKDAIREATPSKKPLKRKERRKLEQERNAEEKGEIGGTPRSNQAQNKQFDDAARGLSKKRRRQLHEAISKQEMSREEIIKTRNDMFPDNPY